MILWRLITEDLLVLPSVYLFPSPMVHILIHGDVYPGYLRGFTVSVNARQSSIKMGFIIWCTYSVLSHY